MSRKTISCLAVLSTVLLTLAAACSGGAPSATSEQPVKLTHAGGSIGGSGQIMSNALGGVGSKWLNVESTVISLPGAAVPDSLLQGMTDIASVGSGNCLDAYYAQGTFAGKQAVKDFRTFLPYGVNVLQMFVPLDSSIKEFKDIKGKRVSAGTKGMGSGVTFDQLAPLLGMTPGKDFEYLFMGHDEAAASLAAHKLDVYIAFGPPPQPTLQELDLRYSLRLIGHSPAEMDTMLKKWPYLLSSPLDKKYYHMDKPVLTYQIPGFFTATPKLSEKVAYGLAKYWIENPDFIGFYAASLKDYVTSGDLKATVENFRAIPYHVGVYKYLKEIGWKVPAEMVPPEAK